MNKIIVFILIVISGCGTADSDSKVLEPITQGIVKTDETGAEIGIWRSPSSPSPQSENFLLGTPFPNPFSGSTNIALEIGNSREVDVWVLPVRLPEETESSYVNEFGPESLSDGRIETIRDGELEEGNTNIRWDANLPRGFYRIYAESEDETLWHDVFIGDPGETGQEMIDYLNNLNE